MSKTTTVVEEDEDKDVPAKNYHGIPGSTFYGRDGTQYAFDAKGRLEVKSLMAQKELDKIVNKPGSTVYTGDTPPPKAANADAPVNEIQAKAAQTMADLAAQQKR